MKILVPTAGPVPAKERAEYILKIAKELCADVDALHIIDTGKAEKTGTDALTIFSETGKKLGVTVKTHLKKGKVVPTIVKFIKTSKPDLVIMGASAGRVVGEWLVTNVIGKSKIPVVIIPEGFSEIEI